MLDKAIVCGLCGALLFGGLTAAAIAAGWFLAIMAAVILLCAALYCVAAIAEANAETEPRPIADDVRRVKIKEKPWVRKYYNGEFDPEDDTSRPAEPTAETVATKIRKFVFLERIAKMKDYTQSIRYMREERPKQSEAHRQYYTDAIEAMKRLTPTEPKRKLTSPNMFCSHCGKEFWFRNEGDRKHGERVCNNCGQHMKWDWSRTDLMKMKKRPEAETKTER